MKKILIVDDDKNYANSLSAMFEGIYDVLVVDNTKDGEQELLNRDYDLVILDYYIGDVTGAAFYDLCVDQLSEKKVIVLSGGAGAKEMVDMLDKPVMDFMDKATPPEVIFKKIERFMNGDNIELTSKKINSLKEGIELDIENRTALKNGEVVKLTNKEFLILKMLMESKNTVLDRDDIFEQIWGYVGSYESLRLVDVNVLKVRKKLNIASIVSKRGVGYVWEEES